MRFIGKNGQEFVTINELFISKKFIKSVNSYFVFFDYTSGKEEVWTFIDSLMQHIPYDIDIKKMNEIVSDCGWCKKIASKP